MFEDDAPTMLGRYKLLAKLATGGMAEIHLAHQSGIEGFKRLVVLKRILPHLATQARFVEMFLDEARIAAQLNHSNIVHIYDLGKAGKDYFIAMEYLEGESLGYVIRQARAARRPPSPWLAAGIVLQVCEGLDYAHRYKDTSGAPLQIVHRDVSPHNIIVLFSGGVKLVDFGIAKASSQVHQTVTGTVKGKPTYMSPEQLLAMTVDARSDIFSIGVILWELLTRRRLFKRDSDAASIQAVINETIPAVREIRPDVPEVLERIAMRALEKDPSDRFQTAGDMAVAIDLYLRRTGRSASNREVAAFMTAVFRDRARSKRQILDRIQSNGADSISLGPLKPASEESIPSGCKAGEEAGPDSALAGQDDQHSIQTLTGDGGKAPKPDLLLVGRTETAAGGAIDRQPGEDRSPPEGSRRWLAMAVVFLLSAGLGSAIWLLGPIGGAGAKLDAAGRGPADLEPSRAENEALGPEGGGRQPAAQSVVEPLVGATDRHKVGPSIPKGADESGARGVQEPLPGQAGHTSEPAPGGQPEPRINPDHPDRARLDEASKPKPRQKKRRRQKARPITPVAAAQGLLNLNTEPWSEVYLGKRKLGMTPLIGLELAPGDYRLTAVNEGLGIRERIRVSIRSGKLTESFVQLGQ